MVWIPHPSNPIHFELVAQHMFLQGMPEEEIKRSFKIKYCIFIHLNISTLQQISVSDIFLFNCFKEKPTK